MSDQRSCPYYYSNAPPGSGSAPAQFVLYRPFTEVLLLAIVQFFFFLLLVLFDALSQQPIALFTEFTLLLIAVLGIVIYFLRDEEFWIYYVLAVAFGLAIDIAFFLVKIVIVIWCDVHRGCSDYTIWFLIALFVKFVVILVQVHALVISYEAYRDWEFFKRAQLRKPLSYDDAF